ncbi:MAG: 1-acyl-sn-glycerol-3-phosphate acyltransferase [Lentisphaeria bacterium]|nr:1-acyl-sn-glycerol-3-phosphate acyltransferase [Lentisphaeria bacterium]
MADLQEIALFKGDNYDTPESVKRSWFDRLVLGCRINFYWRNFMIFKKTGALGRQGKLDRFSEVFYSNQNIKIVESCGGKFHLSGLNNVHNLHGEPVVIIGNHMSLLETAIMHAIIGPDLKFTFVIKEALLRVPYFGDIMRSMEAIPVGRDNPREDLRTVLNRGKELLQQGRSIIIFPQSTRSEIFEPDKFNSIGVKLAKSAGVRVLPMALKTDFLENGKYLRDIGRVRRDRPICFAFGEPLTVEGNGKETQEKIIEFILANLTRWGHIKPQA